MKITAVRSYPVMTWRPHLFIIIETDEGIHGVGEAGLTWQEMSVHAAINRLSSLIIGQDPMRTQHLWQLMFRSGFFPADSVGCAAISAIDIALWDIKGKALNQPVYNLLGGLVREKIACYPHNQVSENEDDLDSLLESCKNTWNAGWKFVRWGMPILDPVAVNGAKSVRESIKQITAIRETLGDEVEICIDVHTRLEPPDAIRFCREVEELRPFFIEDALRSESPEAYRYLRKHVNIPIAAGEQWSTKWGFRSAIEEELIDYVRMDLCLVGGISEAMTIARWAETHYINIAPHNPLGPISTAAAAHVCFATSNLGVLEMAKEPGTVLTDIFPTQTLFDSGHVIPSNEPGLGITLDENVLAEYPLPTDGFAPQLTKADGSFSNW